MPSLTLTFSRPHRLGSVLLALGLLALLALAPTASAQSDAPDSDCDFPVVVKTTPVTYSCAGELVESPDEPDIVDDETPGERTCGRGATTGLINASETDCVTARRLVALRRGRVRYYALSFNCIDRRGLVTCRRRANDERIEAMVSYRRLRR